MEATATLTIDPEFQNLITLCDDRCRRGPRSPLPANFHPLKNLANPLQQPTACIFYIDSPPAPPTIATSPLSTTDTYPACIKVSQ